MDDCQVRPISNPIPNQQCQDAIKAYTELLGTGTEQNYRFECHDA